MSETLFELERAYDRSDLAAVFREFADALEAGTTVELHTAETHLSVDVPERVVAELEAEREDDDPPVSGLELELEWDDPDGTSVRVRDADAAVDVDTAAVEDADPVESPEGGESPTDSATAAMPPEAVPGGTESTADRDRTERTSGDEGRRSRFEVYQDRADEWRWRLIHWNGNIIADSGEGYTSRSNAERAARGVMRNAPTARVEHRDA